MLLNFLYFHPIFFFIHSFVGSLVRSLIFVGRFSTLTLTSSFPFPIGVRWLFTALFYSILFDSDFRSSFLFFFFHRLSFWRSTHSHSSFHTIRITHLNFGQQCKIRFEFFFFCFCYCCCCCLCSNLNLPALLLLYFLAHFHF